MPLARQFGADSPIPGLAGIAKTRRGLVRTLPVLLRRRDSSEQGGRGALCVRRAGGERAGVELLLGAQERSLSVDVPAGVAFEGEEDVLRPAVHDAVQKALGSRCQSLGETIGEVRALVSRQLTTAP